MSVGGKGIEVKSSTEQKREAVITKLQDEINGSSKTGDSKAIWGKDGTLSQAELMKAVLELNMLSQVDATVDSAVAKDESGKVNIARKVDV